MAKSTEVDCTRRSFALQPHFARMHFRLCQLQSALSCARYTCICSPNHRLNNINNKLWFKTRIRPVNMLTRRRASRGNKAKWRCNRAANLDLRLFGCLPRNEACAAQWYGNNKVLLKHNYSPRIVQPYVCVVVETESVTNRDFGEQKLPCRDLRVGHPPPDQIITPTPDRIFQS